MMKTRMRWVVYLGSGIFFFLFWLYIVFPTDALKSRVITEIENKSQGLYRVETESMGFSIFGSLTFKNLKISQPMGGGQENILLKTPYLKLGFSPFALLSKNPNAFSFDLKGSKGNLTGKYRQDPDEFSLDMELNDFALGDIPWLAQKAQVGLQGTVDGVVELNLNKADPTQNAGKIDVALKNLSIDTIKINLDPSAPEAALEIPGFQLTGKEDSFIKAEIQKEDFNLQGIQLKGGDIDLNLDGKVTLRGPTTKDYRLALQGNFKISEGLYKNLSALQFVLEQQKTPEGIYPLTLSGRLGKPTIRIGKFTLPI